MYIFAPSDLSYSPCSGVTAPFQRSQGSREGELAACALLEVMITAASRVATASVATTPTSRRAPCSAECEQTPAFKVLALRSGGGGILLSKTGDDEQVAW